MELHFFNTNTAQGKYKSYRIILLKAHYIIAQNVEDGRIFISFDSPYIQAIYHRIHLIVSIPYLSFFQRIVLSISTSLQCAF